MNVEPSSLAGSSAKPAESKFGWHGMPVWKRVMISATLIITIPLAADDLHTRYQAHAQQSCSYNEVTGQQACP